MTSPSTNSPAAIGQRALDAAIAAAWQQWSVLGASGDVQQSIGSTIDAEALVLASGMLVEHERRVGDFLLWWAEVGATLMSVQRIRSQLKSLPPAAADLLRPFAASAVEAGDRRWRGLAGVDVLDARSGKGADRPKLRHPTALVLRLRAAFGVSAKADVLALLFSLDRPATVREVAEATGYTTVAVRDSLHDISLAGFAAATGTSPATYRATKREAWAELLGDGALPTWGYWSSVYPALLEIAAWAAQATDAGWSDYVAASKARDLSDRHASAFRRFAPDVRLDEARGEAMLPVFGVATDALIATALAAR